MSNTRDVVIIGGGVIGCSCAYFLAASKTFRGNICVIERDPSYQQNSTSRSVGGIRQQFSTPENIRMSQFAVQFLREAGSTLALEGKSPNLTFIKNGYLLLATKQGLHVLKDNIKIQHAECAQTKFLSPIELTIKFPWLRTNDLAGGSFGATDEGWIDPYALMQAFKEKAHSLGAIFVKDDVISMITEKTRIAEIGLASGDTVSCDTVINAAGSSAYQIAEFANLKIPISPRKRFVFVFDCHDTLMNCPLTVDPTGIYFRPEGETFICGKSPNLGDPDPHCTDLEVDYNFFYESIWPNLAHRVPAFEAIKIINAWAGTYAYNTLDQNAIIGRHPDVVNMIFANGFSGHGLQQSPAIGRAVSELVIYNAYRTLDLSRFGLERILRDDPIAEINVI